MTTPDRPTGEAPTLADSLGRLRDSIAWLRDGVAIKSGIGVADMVVIEAALSAQAAPAMMVASDELPPLPPPSVTYADHSYPAYNKRAMQEYARQALAAPAARGEDAELQSLRRFVGAVLGEFPEHGTLDPFDAQELAVECGLLVEELCTAPCGESCQCAEWGQEGVTMCFRIQPALRSAIDAARAARSTGEQSE